MICLHNKIKQLRLQNNLSRKDLAKALNISYAALSKYETGERIPDISLIINIAKYFDVSLDSLLADDEDIDSCNSSSICNNHIDAKNLTTMFSQLDSDCQVLILNLIQKLNKK